MKIYLFCSAGMSTSLLVTKMKQYVESIGEDHTIEAFSESSIGEYGNDADVILLGPQIKFKEKSIKSQFPDKNVEAINMQHYGLCNGEEVFKRAKELYEKKGE